MMKIILGISGSISAYKSANLIRYLKTNNNEVRVIATESALEFITETTLKTLSQNEVWIQQFGKTVKEIRHIEITEWGDLLLIAPASANICSKAAHAIGDDLLSTTILAALNKLPIIMCPAMNTHMYENPIFQDNLKTLIKNGVSIVEPDSGDMACGATGKGRFPDEETILFEIEKFLSPKPLKNINVLITAGPTLEPIDPVRYITNHSSGKMGYELARTASILGGKVILIHGKTDIPMRIPSAHTIFIKTAEEMADAFFHYYPNSSIAICAAAVADYKIQNYSSEKIKKKQSLHLELVKNPDILAKAGSEKRTNQHLTGFSLETSHEIENGIQKKNKKNCDLMVINNPIIPGSEFGGDTNQITLIDKKNKTIPYENMSKRECSKLILKKIIEEYGL